MMTFSRHLAKQIRSVFRRALQISASQTDQVVWLVADDSGLHIRAQSHRGIAEYHMPGAATPGSIPVTMEALAACEGTKADESVSVERRADGVVALNWCDRGVPQQFQLDANELHPEPPPALPDCWGSNPPSLLGAMDAAMRIAPNDATRFALNCVQLRPGDGRIAVTDSRQLLVQSGFTFPWSGDVLVQRSPVFRCRELVSDEPVAVGVTANHFVIRTGPWTHWLLLEKQGRYPTFEAVIPAADTAKTRLRLTDEDVEYLLDVMPRLPKESPTDPRVTLDLNGSVSLLARGTEPSPVTQVILSNSRRQGDEVRLDTDRQFLAHAVGLGFREIELFGPTSPAVCRDATRVYLWSAFEEQPAIVASSDTVRLASPLTTSPSHRPARHLPPARRQHHPAQERTPTRMAHNRIAATLAGSAPPPVNGSAQPVAEPNEPSDQSTSFGTVLREAEAVKTSLRDAHGQVSRLIAALKRHRRQSKLVQTTLASLKQLQSLEA